MQFGGDRLGDCYHFSPFLVMAINAPFPRLPPTPWLVSKCLLFRYLLESGCINFHLLSPLL
ncbi:hypothetical protein SPLC1_S031480 [Arthrospira platensis C1]|nr:hypothetical protein SPLC1_S031480 [Arthrospira platensis C1]